MFFLVAGSVQGAGLLLGVSGWGAVVVGVGSVMAGSLASRSLLRALWARS